MGRKFGVLAMTPSCETFTICSTHIDNRRLQQWHKRRGVGTDSSGGSRGGSGGTDRKSIGGAVNLASTLYG